jgi:ABC-type glutathione transport system ATPase component
VDKRQPTTDNRDDDMSALAEYTIEADGAAAGAKALIQLEDITKTYDAGENAVQALGGIDVAIQYGQFVSIIGPSGSGKSTLMHILGSLGPGAGSHP